MVGVHLNARNDSSWLICKLGQAYGEWEIDLIVLITRESEFSTPDPTLIKALHSFIYVASVNHFVSV